MGSHIDGEGFAMVETDAVRPIELPLSALGAAVIVQARGLGDGGSGAPVSRVAGGEALRSPSPVHPVTKRLNGGGLDLTWVRRSPVRLGLA